MAGGHADSVNFTEVLEGYEAFVNESDANQLGDLYAEDAILTPEGFQVFERAEAITVFRPTRSACFRWN